MSELISCFRCGESLEKLSLPLSRRDECPSCTVHVHVCRMCVFFDRNVPMQCREDGAEEVIEKEKVNFCDWFKPSSTAFDPERAEKEARARSELGTLFGGESTTAPDSDSSVQDADDLFR